MAQVNKQKPGVTSVGGQEIITWLHVANEDVPGSTKTGFAGLALDLCASGNITTYYYWPNTSGVLRYGTTAPTVATQDSAGSAV